MVQRSVDLQIARTRGLQFNAQGSEKQDLEVRATLSTAVVVVLWQWWWSAEASLFDRSATPASMVISRPALGRSLW